MAPDVASYRVGERIDEGLSGAKRRQHVLTLLGACCEQRHLGKPAAANMAAASIL